MKTFNDIQVGDELYCIVLGKVKKSKVECIDKKGEKTLLLLTEDFMRRVNLSDDFVIVDDNTYGYINKDDLVRHINGKLQVVENRYKREVARINDNLNILQNI